MKRQRWFVAVITVVVLGAALRLAVSRTYLGGYRVVDDDNLALQVIGANPTWRSITVQTETPSDVIVGVSEINTRRAVDSSTGVEITRLPP